MGAAWLRRVFYAVNFYAIIFPSRRLRCCRDGDWQESSAMAVDLPSPVMNRE
jgi:hypothetical protein